MTIYLDHNASTPVAAEVVEAMQPYLQHGYGNPSSRHWASDGLQNALAKARSQVASLLGCASEEVVFTSGGSEASNHALKGAYFASGRRDAHIVTTQIEHPATIETCRFLERLGAEVSYLPVDREGMLDPEDVWRAVTERTILVSVMHANNEVGTVQPISEVASIAREHGVLCHTDAAQSSGKIPVDVGTLGVDLLTLAGHKLYAPKGVGMLYIKSGVELEPLIHGGGQEDGRRSGTESIVMAVALGAACALAESRLAENPLALTRDYFWEKLYQAFGDQVVQNGAVDRRLPNTLNVSFVRRDGSKLLEALEGIAASTGSACHEDKVTMSPVLAAMDVGEDIAMGAIRFSVGFDTTKDDIETTVSALRKVLVDER